MARVFLFFLVLCFVLYMAGMAESTVARHSKPTDFIQASCRATRYPALCVQCLSQYASAIKRSDRQLAQTALSVSLARVRSAAAYVAKMTKVRGIKGKEYQAVKDCIENMGDSVDRLSQSVRELGHMGRAVGQDFMWHMSNVQTWVSAALTDENTCLDGFDGHAMDGNVKAAVNRRVTNVAQVTSNALALVNRFASKHQATTSLEKP
ncbi:pectinesterase inhibitor 7 [Quercus suber]|uniref:Pectinesterase inhibitor 7 n=2 Tax=Quercus suber TaxID=58331 RepID=A0AAW0LNE4_QUESU|nr:pectinesterase inhibitor 7-like [Quercus suber]